MTDPQAEQPQPDHDVPTGPEDAGHLWPQKDWDDLVADADAIAWRQTMDAGEAGR